MRIEVKGLIAGLVAALAVLGLAFGAAEVATHMQGSKAALPAQSAPAARPDTTAADAASVVQGHAFFTQSCASCHGAKGAGGYGPALRREDMSDAQIASKIAKGVPGKMPAFAKKYGAGQTKALVAYIRSLK